MGTLISEINKSISSLPENALEDLKKYIDFLAYKHGDWADTLTDAERISIDKGLKDIDDNNVKSHALVQEKMRKYLSEAQ